MRRFLGCLLGIMIVVGLPACAANNQSARRTVPQLVIVSPDDSSTTTSAIKDSLFKEWTRDQVTPQKVHRPKHAHKHRGYWAESLGSLFTVRTTPVGVETEFHSPAQSVYNNLQNRPKLFQQYPGSLGGGWKEVTYDPVLFIPFGETHVNLRLQPYGHPDEIWFRYEGEGWQLSKPEWRFWIENQGAVSDDYYLVTYVRYTTGEIDSTVRKVQNQQVR